MRSVNERRGSRLERTQAAWAVLVPQLINLLLLLVTVTTLLFFLLRVAGDPAYVLAGAGATPEQLAAIRLEYGLNQPLWVQYLAYLRNLSHLDFGRSLGSGEPALTKVLECAPRTLGLAVSAMVLSVAIAVPIGGWLGFRRRGRLQRIVAGAVFVLQGIPGFVMALLLTQLLAVNLRWVPSMGYSATDLRTWVLPTLSLSAFLVPALIRMIAANIAELTTEDFIRTARAYGASPREILWRHALPNALLGTTALLGAQFTHLLGGSTIVESIFAWPGMGWLLLQSVTSLDFPVIEAEAFVVAITVFVVYTFTELGFRVLDPRLRTRRA
jgi:peptide/nickel transport system permease protein